MGTVVRTAVAPHYSINLGNSSTLIFLPVTTAHGADLCLKGFAKATLVILLHFLGIKLDFKPHNIADDSSLCYMFPSTVGLYVQTVSNLKH